MEKRKVSHEQVVSAIADIAFDDIGRYLSYETGGDGRVEVRMRDSREVDTRNIKEISVGKDGRLTFKLYSRERALYKLIDLVEPDGREAQDGLMQALRASVCGQGTEGGDAPPE